MIFNWVDGQVLKAEEIKKKHSEIIGGILAKIHNIDFTEIEDKGQHTSIYRHAEL